MAKPNLTQKIHDLMTKPEKIRNMGIVAHIDHGKTTLSDSLLTGAGMLSEKVAGEARALDFLEEEQERGITIQASNISMIHNFRGDEFMINLIDTPGHVDFGGDVTRAMRAVDGALVVLCAVEGPMPQTETVLRQALKERVRPVLFINKVDRLIKELKLKPDEMQQRLIHWINGINELIKTYAPKEFAEKWKVNVLDGSVSFGSAVDKWALSFPYMKERGITFKEIIDAYDTDDKEKRQEIARKAPLHEILLDMAIKHFPNPKVAQGYRIPGIWKGDLESDVGRALLTCDANGPLVVEVTKVTVDEFGEIATGRIFSGKIRQGDILKLIKGGREERIQQIGVYKGAQRVPIDEAIAGNIIAIVGLKDTFSGETISNRMVDPFEAISHIFEPVVTKAVEAKNPKDLPKLVEVLKGIEKEDPTIRVQINEETGEHLMSGLGELHLEWIEQKIIKYKGVDVRTSQPIVVYRESVAKKSPIAEGKSPNKHNKFYMTIEPLDAPLHDAMKRGLLEDMRIKPKDKEFWKELNEFGMDKEEARSVKDIYRDCMFLDMTKGIVQIREVLPMVMDAFEEIVRSGPLAREPVLGIKVKLIDVSLHEDAIHRGPAQVLPAVRESLRNAMIHAEPVLFEPVRELRIDSPVEYMGAVTKLVQSRRGSILDMDQTDKYLVMMAKMPVAASFGFTSELRSASSGRAVWSLRDIAFEQLPKSMQDEIIKGIRDRKGLAVNQI